MRSLPNLPKIIVIIGPTATGKTELGIRLAKKFGGEVISADSRQVYKGMDVGTGKPRIGNKESPHHPDKSSGGTGQVGIRNKWIVIEGVKHYLMSIVNPDTEFTVAIWKKKALVIIKDILKRKKLPIIVGGTGLYIKSLVQNLDIPQVPPDFALRAKLESGIKNQGLKFFYEKLLKCDPSAEGIVDSKNARRVIRALEVCIITGRPFSSLQRQGKSMFEILELGISIPRKELYKRIDRRVWEMYKTGLLAETKKLLKKYPAKLPAMSGIGYKEAGEYLIGKITVDEAISLTKFRTHAYARRQLTWFRKDKSIKWIRMQKQTERLIKIFLTSGGKK